jgi:EAL and modified HD-GYP domain-containing signal transduction protein
MHRAEKNDVTSGQHTPVVRIARQSIVDRERTVQAYELLFRGTVDPERGFDGTEASATSLVTAMLDIGWDQLRGGHPLYLNVDQDFLLSRLVHVAPPESTVVELVGGVVDSPEVHAAVLELKALGFKIAIDDFMGQDDVEQLLHLADVVKVDRLDIELDELTAIVELVHQRNALALAERVEDEETFQRCLEAGFDLFEGYHFDRPQPQEGGVTASQAVSLQLATLLQGDSPDPAEIEHLLRADVGLSYRVLRLANSSASGVTREVSSLRQAIVLVGPLALAGWVSLMLLSDSGQNSAAIDNVLIAARMCELLVTADGGEPAPAFLVGLLDGVAAILDVSKEEVLDTVRAAPQIRSAVLQGEGQLGLALRRTQRYLSGAPFGQDDSWEAYLEALGWLNSLPRKASAA